MSKIETAAAPLFNILIEGGSLSDSQRYDLANFFALAFVRTNSFRRMYAEFYSEYRMLRNYLVASNDSAFELQMERFQQARGKISEEAKQRLRAHMIDPSDYIIQVSHEYTLQALACHGRLVPLFYTMNWSILYAPEDSFFITSDNPLLQWVPPQYHHSFYGSGGFRSRHAEAIMTLSPHYCWVGHWREDMPRRFVTVNERVEFTNELIAVSAERFLYSHTEDKSILALAKQYAKSQKTFHFEGQGPAKKAEIKVVRSL